MAKAPKSFLGDVRGKIANVVFTTWKEIPVARSIQRPYSSRTPAQLRQRKRFTLARQFIKHTAPVINAGFKWNTEKMSEQNSALSYTMKRALKGGLEDLDIDYSLVLVARGDLPKPRDGQSGVTPEGNISFSWAFDSEEEAPRGKDKALVLAYCPAMKQSYYLVDGSVRRRDREYTLELPEVCKGQALETYLAFTSENGKEASESVYLGRVVV